MSFVQLLNQPFVIGDVLEQPCLNNDTTLYTQLVAQGDPSCVQWKQDPCSQVLCDWNAETEQLTNPTFSGSATGWTLALGWTYATNDVDHSGTVSTISQAIVLPAGYYRYSYELTSVGVNGQAQIRADGVFLGPGLSTIGIDTGIYNGAVAGNIDVRGTNSVTLDNVSFKKLLTCWTYSADWEMDEDGYVCHDTGNTTNFTTNTAPITAGVRYKISITVKGRTAGSISVTVGGVTMATISTNGTYTYYYTALGSGELVIVPTTDFDGCIGDISAGVMSDDFEIELIDQDGVSVTDVYDDTSLDYPIVYENEYCTWCFQVSDLEDGGSAANLPSGCYRLKLTDNCASTSLTSNLFSYDNMEETDPCSVLITATNGTGERYGFYWGNFSLIQRLRILRITPRYPAKGEDYFDSTGENFRIFGQTSKIYQAWFDYMDEQAHDATRIQVLSQNISIKDSNSVTTEYFCPVKDYEPEWIDNNRRNLSQSRVDMTRKVDVLFGRSC